MPLPSNLPTGVMSNGASVADQVNTQQQQLRQKRQQLDEANQTLGIGLGSYGDALPPKGGY